MTELRERIKELEQLEARQIAGLKLQAQQTAESMRPSNLVKSAFSEMIKSKGLKQDALKASVGIGAGILLKKIITRHSGGIFRKIAGFALQAVTTKLIAKKLPGLKQKVARL
jgi:hypothetical protein